MIGFVALKFIANGYHDRSSAALRNCDILLAIKLKRHWARKNSAVRLVLPKFFTVIGIISGKGTIPGALKN